MTPQAWKISGEYMEACNCDYVCPCILSNSAAPATHDNCTVLLIFRIDDGTYGDISLEGLCFAVVARTKPIMSAGDWTLGGVVDEKADPQQRAALMAIVSGDAGGPVAMMRENLVSDFTGVDVRPMDFQIDGFKRSTSVPGLLDLSIEGVASGSVPGEPLYLENAGHPANTKLALATSSEMHIHGLGIEWDQSGGNNGHYAPFSWSA